ncbi:hypothetical protein C8P66_11912 [Humitalea rosea]|uniref:SCP-2 sterol transfer family protein n=1 Tax=Humitalea rosea TaxID=990373 RepID=A0A2W7K3C2_9PROT|nr:hypothetical protein [Humitalea rosea]PZW42120.1 hypothetical protein C8P66_11912 [Humitalea rosea]
MRPEALPAVVNADPVLRRWGRNLTTTLLLEVGSQSWLLRIHDGVMAEVRGGPFVMPSWIFALRADPAAWAEFVQPEPPPGRHDLFALIRHGKLHVEGDLHPFMSHLLWFKSAFAALRRTEIAA